MKKKGILDKNNKYNLIEVVIIMIITSFISVLFTIKVSYAVNNTNKKIITRADLSEFIDVYDSIIREYYTDIDKNELIDYGIKGMLSYLDDPYTTYMNEEETNEFNETLEGEYVGIGTEITLKDNKPIIVTVFENSPAEKAGLKVNDIIVKVGNEDVSKMSLSDMSKIIKGKEGTKFNITVERNKKQISFDIVRGKVEIDSVSTEIFEKNGKKVGYISVSTFANNTYKQFKEKEKELEEKKVEGLIIDLRGNTGGYLSTVQSMMEMFLDKGQIMYQLEVKGKTSKIKSKEEKSIDLKTVILVNGGSASASEIFTAALKENLNTEVIGTKTYGKGKVQKSQMLSSGAMIKYTIENWLTPNGNPIDKLGIEPTILLPLSTEFIKNPSNKTDNQLQKAIEVITKE